MTSLSLQIKKFAEYDQPKYIYKKEEKITILLYLCIA